MPEWMRNASQYDSSKRAKAVKKIKRKGRVKEVLKEAGLTITVDNLTEGNVIDAELDPERNKWDEMSLLAEGRLMTASQKVMRDAFVSEFLKDFKGVEAATRIGSVEPVTLWREMIACPYVQRLISKRMIEWEGEAMVTRNAIVARYWQEANDYIHGTATSRINATAKLAELMGYTTNGDINPGIHDLSSFLEKPLSEQEFIDMKQAFDSEF